MNRMVHFGHSDLYMYEHPELGGSLYDYPCRRLGRRLFEPAPPDPQLHRPLSFLARRPRLGALPVQCRHASLRLARPPGRRLRRDHRRGPARRGLRSHRRLSGRHDRHASGIPFDPDVGRDEGVDRSRRPAHVYGRQWLVLARRLPRRAAGRDRAPPRRGRHPHLDRRAGRILPFLQRRVWRSVAAHRARAQRHVRRRLRRAGLRHLHLLPPRARCRQSARRLHLRGRPGRDHRQFRSHRRRRRRHRARLHHTRSRLAAQHAAACFARKTTRR